MFILVLGTNIIVLIKIVHNDIFCIFFFLLSVSILSLCSNLVTVVVVMFTGIILMPCITM